MQFHDQEANLKGLTFVLNIFKVIANQINWILRSN